MKSQQFGVVQLKIMQVLWDKGQANAREITSVLNHDQEIAHSTVQTLLRQLELKGAISHRRENRTFVFRPLVEQDKVVESEIRQLKNRLFSGSAMGLMSYLLKQETIAPEEMNEIKRLIQEKEHSS
jgi:BlaI family transcriptional regulator, penicillinase repressor